MVTTKLTLYNEAADFLGERRLASLTEEVKLRRLLDGVWNENTLNYCLELGLWKFATRSRKVDADTSITTHFGYEYAFVKPTDFVRTRQVSADEYFNIPHTSYVDEAGFWYADIDPLYFSYVSNDSPYGGDLTMWPQTFVRLVGCYMATKICRSMTQSETDLDSLKKDFKDLLVDAKSKNAFEESTKFVPPGTWSQARMRGQAGRERGKRNKLIG